MEQENENVMIGKLIDEESYKRDKKHIYLDDFVCIDIVRDNVICEIKKSSSKREMAEQQLKYYLYLLNKKGIEVKGELLIPKENRKEMIVLNENDKIMIENRLKDINELCNKVIPPGSVLIVKYAKNVHIMSCVIFNNGTIILYFYKWRTSSKR